MYRLLQINGSYQDSAVGVKNAFNGLGLNHELFESVPVAACEM